MSVNLRAHSLANAERFIALLYEYRTRIVADGTHGSILSNEKETTVTQEFVGTFRLQLIVAS
jgi:hypothetical protein